MPDRRSIATRLLAMPLLVAVGSVAADCQEVASWPAHRNEVFARVLAPGLFPDSPSQSLPAPSLPDGLDANEQQEYLARIVGDSFPMEEFVRPSAVAPQITRLSGLESPKERPLKRLDVYFAAMGRLQTLRSDKSLGDLYTEEDAPSETKQLTILELARRGIEPPVDESEPRRSESYAFGVARILDRVELSATTRNEASENSESIVIAGYTDPRFHRDEEFPCRWRPIPRQEGESLQDWSAYDGCSYYVKITRLQGDEPMLLAEGHLMFVEPHGWFGGANLLRSKLPPAVQTAVRRIRRKLMGDFTPDP